MKSHPFFRPRTVSSFRNVTMILHRSKMMKSITMIKNLIVILKMMKKLNLAILSQRKCIFLFAFSWKRNLLQTHENFYFISLRS